MKHKIEMSDKYIEFINKMNKKTLKQIKSEHQRKILQEYFSLVDSAIDSCNSETGINSEQLAKQIEEQLESLKKTLLE